MRLAKIRSCLNQHPIASFALWFVGLWFVLMLVQIVKSYTARVLFSVTILNKRYQYEIVRSTKRGAKLYFNGPYMRAYWRDGRIIQRRHFKDKD